MLLLPPCLFFMFEDDLSSVVVSELDLRERVTSLGAEISEAYASIPELTVLCVTNGAVVFAADLIRSIHLSLRLDCISVTNYHCDEAGFTPQELAGSLRLDIQGRHVLLIDDVVDTGRTLRGIVSALEGLKPRSLKTCVLLSKEGRREVGEDADFIGFTIPDLFVVGYGLDFAERYRNLSCVGVLRPDLQNPPAWQ